MTAPKETLIWTIGSGGLIGSAIDQQSQHPYIAQSINWQDNFLALSDLKENLADFTAQSIRYDNWAIVWAAGAATTATTAERAWLELELFTKFLNELALTSTAKPGEFILISSAGGIYAGSSNPPFTEATVPAPIGIYGDLKLSQERTAEEILKSSQVGLSIARVSNAYGPGQDLKKLQGLISLLALSTIQREPINLFVPLSTVRDFIFTADLARMLQEMIYFPNGPGEPRIKILASENGTSLAYLIKVCQNVFHRKIPIAMGSHPSSKVQAADLRFKSLVENCASQESTALEVGIKVVYDDILHRTTQGSLTKV